MQSRRSASTKFARLILWGIAGLAAGWILDRTGVCPSVKRIWTPSWVLFSGGWSCLLLALFYLVVDCAQWRWIAFPMVVVGMNSIAMYFLADSGFKNKIAGALHRHLGWEVFDKISYRCNPLIEFVSRSFHRPGHTPALSFGPLLESAATLFVLWLICFWMYRRKIFLKI
jgi:predicted acyltransferase